MAMLVKITPKHLILMTYDFVKEKNQDTYKPVDTFFKTLHICHTVNDHINKKPSYVTTTKV
jgi:hypothetical protein